MLKKILPYRFFENKKIIFPNFHLHNMNFLFKSSCFYNDLIICFMVTYFFNDFEKSKAILITRENVKLN